VVCFTLNQKKETIQLLIDGWKKEEEQTREAPSDKEDYVEKKALGEWIATFLVWENKGPYLMEKGWGTRSYNKNRRKKYRQVYCGG